jgi:hypothetical protein
LNHNQLDGETYLVVLRTLQLTVYAINQTFGESYAIKNPDLVSKIFPLVFEVLKNEK